MQTYIRNRVVGGYDLNLIAVVCISTLVLILERYHHLNIAFPRASELIDYVLVPLAQAGCSFGTSPGIMAFALATRNGR